VAEAARNLVCSGAQPVAITNCLNFGNPYKPEVYWTFYECVMGMGEACRKFETPVTGGNVSFYNEDPDRKVYPTPVIGMMGVINELKHITTQWFKDNGDLIVLLGENKKSLDGSEYLKVIHKKISGSPEIDLDVEKRVQDVCLEGIREGLVKSAHDCSEGGLAVALAECCVTAPGSVGAKVNLKDKVRPDCLLFGESQSRILVTVNRNDLDKFEKIAQKKSVALALLGEVGGRKLSINNWINLSVDEIKNLYNCTLEKIMEEAV
jgi:phosphoribosylformylglycinamidine synthase